MRFSFIIIAFFLYSCSTQPVNRLSKTPPTTVQSVDLNRYSGLWYEIARYPNRFEENCINVTAEYTQLPDNKIRVVNSCYDTQKNKNNVAVGRARIIDPETNAKLKVKFAPAWVPFAEGDYWILALDQDYQTALVGSPDGRYLWILARTAQITDAKLMEMKLAAQQKGYDTTAFYMTPQKEN